MNDPVSRLVQCKKNAVQIYNVNLLPFIKQLLLLALPNTKKHSSELSYQLQPGIDGQHVHRPPFLLLCPLPQ